MASCFFCSFHAIFISKHAMQSWEIKLFFGFSHKPIILNSIEMGVGSNVGWNTNALDGSRVGFLTTISRLIWIIQFCKKNLQISNENCEKHKMPNIKSLITVFSLCISNIGKSHVTASFPSLFCVNHIWKCGFTNITFEYLFYKYNQQY